jgi:hypothetical protein
MGTPVVAAYEGEEGDADAELEKLGTRTARRFFRFAQKVVSGGIDHWKLQPFAEYLDAPLYKAEFEDGFTIFLVEDDPDNGISLVLMLALRHEPATVGGAAWDGVNMGFIRDHVLARRLKDYFGG